jgi:hypothetical protein
MSAARSRAATALPWMTRVIFPLVMGTVVYAARPARPVAFDAAPTLAGARREVFHPLASRLPRVIVGSLPDGLWAFALGGLLALVWRGVRSRASAAWLAAGGGFAPRGSWLSSLTGCPAPSTSAISSRRRSAMPQRSAPHPGHATRRVAGDVARGKRVLVSVGSASLVHAGVRDVPRDRVVSLVEPAVAGIHDFGETKARILRQDYDALYVVGLDSPPYPPEIRAVIDEKYHQIGTIKGDDMQRVDEDLLGIQGLMRSGATVLAPNP